MKVYYNKDNSNVYRIFVSAQLGGRTLDGEIVSIQDERVQRGLKRLPWLELDSGQELFSSNAGALYFFPPDRQHFTQVQKWLIWESKLLAPVVISLDAARVSNMMDNQLGTLLGELESALSNKFYLVEDNLTVVDVALWSCLFPVWSDEELCKQYLSRWTKVKSWLDRLGCVQQFKAVVDKLGFGRGRLALTGVVNASALFPPILLSSTSEDIHRNSSTNSERMSQAADDDEKRGVSEDDIKAAIDAWQLSTRPQMKPIKKPVLPLPGETNVLITSALPYVNNVPHLGNIIGCVLSADVFARYCRLRGRNTLYVCGTDEYGTATETKALQEGVTPHQICDKYFEIHRSIYEWFNISFDHFGRTTAQHQTEVVQKMFTACHKNGYTLTEEMDQLLCQKCDKFLADRFVEGGCPGCGYPEARGDQCDGCSHLMNAVELINPKCKICQETPVLRKSQQLFLDLPKLQSKLSDWMNKSMVGWSHNACVISKAWLKAGLKPRCITRDLKWGIPVPLPEFSSKVFYVWFDAPIGYISMTKAYCGSDETGWCQWWGPHRDSSSSMKVDLYQFMAKDNVPFHSIMFPATLIAASEPDSQKLSEYTLVSHLMATEYLNYEDGKFSKSRGIGIFGNDAKDTGLPSDVFRFYLLYVRPEAQDSSFSWMDLATKNNSELLNNLGNFVHRSLTFVDKFFSGEVPKVCEKWTGEDARLLAMISQDVAGYVAALEAVKLREGLRYILNIGRHGNQYMQANQPWVLVKGSSAERARAGEVVGLCANIVGLLAVLMSPYMPDTSLTIMQQIKLPEQNRTIPDKFVPFLPHGHQINKPSVLFNKIEQSTVDELKQRYAGRQQTPPVTIATVNSKPLENNQTTTSNSVDAAQSAAKLEAQIAQQGDKVRGLKSSGAHKSIWQPEVDFLLQLKKNLQEVQGCQPMASIQSGDKSGSKKSRKKNKK